MIQPHKKGADPRLQADALLGKKPEVKPRDD